MPVHPTRTRFHCPPKSAASGVEMLEFRIIHCCLVSRSFNSDSGATQQSEDRARGGSEKRESKKKEHPKPQNPEILNPEISRNPINYP